MVEVMSGYEAGSLGKKEVKLMRIGVQGFNFVSENASWWAEHRIARMRDSAWGNPKTTWTRAVRAIVLLEHFATPGAVAILRDMAAGHPDAQPTKVAKDALKRLGEAGKNA
jgi:hypothetical protein